MIPQWKYRYERLTGIRREHLIETLNALGEDGWELFKLKDRSTLTYVDWECWFKMEVSSQ